MAQKPLGSVFLNPIGFAASWHYITIAGVRSPGAIAVDGFQGFEREVGWDKKKGKGAQGATLTLTTQPPAEGSIEFQLWLADHFLEWNAFRDLLKYRPAKGGAAAALDIYHPCLADLEINSVVCSKIGPILHRGRGLYTIKLDFIEWLPPPPVSITKTTNSSQPNNPDNSPGDQPDTALEAKQQQALLLGRRAGFVGAP